MVERTISSFLSISRSLFVLLFTLLGVVGVVNISIEQFIDYEKLRRNDVYVCVCVFCERTFIQIVR